MILSSILYCNITPLQAVAAAAASQKSGTLKRSKSALKDPSQVETQPIPGNDLDEGPLAILLYMCRHNYKGLLLLYIFSEAMSPRKRKTNSLTTLRQMDP